MKPDPVHEALGDELSRMVAGLQDLARTFERDLTAVRSLVGRVRGQFEADCRREVAVRAAIDCELAELRRSRPARKPAKARR